MIIYIFFVLRLLTGWILQVVLTTLMMLCNLRNTHTNKRQTVLGFYFNGEQIPRNVMRLLTTLGLAPSYSCILDGWNSVAASGVQLIKKMFTAVVDEGLGLFA